MPPHVLMPRDLRRSVKCDERDWACMLHFAGLPFKVGWLEKLLAFERACLLLACCIRRPLVLIQVSPTKHQHQHLLHIDLQSDK